MVAVNSTMLALGTPAPDFTLATGDGQPVTFSELRQGAPASVVMFLSNHCPYVQHVAPALAPVCGEFQHEGVAVIGVMSNDVDSYPADAPEAMVAAAAEWGWTFPYVYDPDQQVAVAYRAACTPDLYVFDAAGHLAYRGQFDSSRPKNDEPVTGTDLRAAVQAVLAGKQPTADQWPSLGCNIKWKPGNEPAWFC